MTALGVAQRTVELDQPIPAGHTPRLIMDLGVVEARHHELRALFPDALIHYAVKANPAGPVLRRLAGLGCRFDVASDGERRLVAGLGVPPAHVSFGNAVKKAADIAAAFRAGVRLYAVDSAEELHKVAAHAPGAAVMVRLLVESGGAQWPLSRKFGCSPELAARLLLMAPSLGLRAAGLSFHVGSQQTRPASFAAPIALCAELGRYTAARGVALPLLNIGGGLPARYLEPTPPVQAYAQAIHAALQSGFGLLQPRLMLEPGRSLVADAGTLETEVVLVSRRHHPDPLRWVYLDCGRFGGLAETEAESIKYRLTTPHDGTPVGPVVLAGPTCDSTDILYERHRYQLPLALDAGDRVRVLSAGAYTASYASVGFNGFGPPTTEYGAG